MIFNDRFVPKPQWYCSSERASEEWQHVWTRTWHIGPRLEELPQPGDVMLHTLGPESLLFVRGEDGVVRGLFNVCRHRGSALLLAEDGPACVRELHCPFHGWRYDLAGRLLEVPYRERFDEADLADPARSHLRPFRVEAFAGWAWYTLDVDAPALREYLGPLGPKLAAYSMERARIVDYKTFDFACNWKTAFDAFNESYHFQSLHSDILSWGNEDAPITLLNIHSMMVNEYGRPSRLHGDQLTVNPALQTLLSQNGIDPQDFTGTAADVRKALQQAKRASQQDSIFPYATLNDAQLTDAHHYMMFPSIHFNLFPEFYVAMRYRPHSSGNPQRMYFDFIMCCPVPEGEEVPPYEHRVVRGEDEPVAQVLRWGKWEHPVVNQVLQEDVGLVAYVQRGQQSQGFTQPILGSDERRIAHFHESVDLLIAGHSIRELIANRVTEADAHPGI